MISLLTVEFSVLALRTTVDNKIQRECAGL